MQGQVDLRGVTMVMPIAPTYYLVPWQNQWAQKAGRQRPDRGSDPHPL